MDLQVVGASGQKYVNDADSEMSVLASQGGDLIITDKDLHPNVSMERSDVESSGSLPNITSENLAQLVLQHEAKLLEKDKEIATIGQMILDQQGEIDKLNWELCQANESNSGMMSVVGEYEATITQLIEEKERETVRLQMEREKVEKDRMLVLQDLQAVQQAFKDLQNRYERTKELIGNCKFKEDKLKSQVKELSSRFKKGEERYEVLKTDAESRLKDANDKMVEVGKSKEAEIARLTAMLRKAEMNVTSLQRNADEKDKENKELTKICDDLISKVGK